MRNYNTRSKYYNLPSVCFLSWDDLLCVLFLAQSVIGLGVMFYAA